MATYSRDHIGIVAKYDKSTGILYTVEGNTGKGQGSVYYSNRWSCLFQVVGYCETDLPN